MPQRSAAETAAAHAPSRRNKPRVKWLGAFEDLPTALQVRRPTHLADHSGPTVPVAARHWGDAAERVRPMAQLAILTCCRPIFTSRASAVSAVSPFLPECTRQQQVSCLDLGRSAHPARKEVVGSKDFSAWPVLLPQDNNFIRSGYRLGHSSYDVARSLFSWHNETGNIHTHLLGFLLFLALTFVAAWKAPAPFQLGSAAAAHVRCGTTAV